MTPLLFRCTLPFGYWASLSSLVRHVLRSAIGTLFFIAVTLHETQSLQPSSMSRVPSTQKLAEIRQESPWSHLSLWSYAEPSRPVGEVGKDYSAGYFYMTDAMNEWRRKDPLLAYRRQAVNVARAEGSCIIFKFLEDLKRDRFPNKFHLLSAKQPLYLFMALVFRLFIRLYASTVWLLPTDLRQYDTSFWEVGSEDWASPVVDEYDEDEDDRQSEKSWWTYIVDSLTFPRLRVT